MNIREWLARFRKSRDAAAMSRAEAESVETPEERTYTAGDIDAIRADERAAELTGDTPSESKHLGE